MGPSRRKRKKKRGRRLKEEGRPNHQLVRECEGEGDTTVGDDSSLSFSVSALDYVR